MATNPGPIIDDHPTTITLLSPAELQASPHFSALITFINTTFATTPSIAALLRNPPPRLNAPSQLIEEIGPECFTLLLTSRALDPATGAEAFTIHGTASGRRLLPKAASDNVVPVFKTMYELQLARGAAHLGREPWELKMVVVDTALQGRGVGGLLMRAVEEEVVRRAEGGKAVLLLDTIKELHEPFYARKGFTTWQERRMEAGLLGAERAWTVVFMEKVLGE